MLDLKQIRVEPDHVAAALSKRGLDGTSIVNQLVALDEERRHAISQVVELKAERNEASRLIGEKKRAGEDAAVEIEATRALGDRIDELDHAVRRVETAIEEILLVTPNLPLPEVPEGGVDCNELVRSWGTLPEFTFEPQPHWDVAENLGILDLPRGAKVSGSGFPVLRGQGARLQRVLIDAMLDLHTRNHGYEELRVPYLVTTETLMGTGQLPKFEEESYLTERDDLWLIPTAEVPVTNLHRDEILDGSDFPIKYTAYSPCFRREAGAAGSDTRGLLRVHQFDKVELVRYETPDNSREALEEITGEAERILQLLQLPYRVLKLAAGDLGFSSAMTYDLEVWAPGVQRWLEVSSCSVFTDFQSRRANIRFRGQQGDKPQFLHTLNGSALALPRLMVAIIETYQEADGSIRIPVPLQDRFGADRIEFK